MKKSTLLLFLTIAAVVLNSSCNQKKSEKIAFGGEAQGTYYSITYFDSLNRNFQPQIDSLLKAFDQSLSLWVENSIISRVNNNDTSASIDQLFEVVFNTSQKISEASEGAFDITVGPLVRAWGFSFKKGVNPDQNMIDSLHQLVGYHRVKLVNHKLIKDDPRIQVDFNAIAQGYSSDVIGDFLESKGITNYLVDVGGEIIGKGVKPDNKPWIVGIEKPADSATAERVVTKKIKLKDQAVATSGSYRKYFEKEGKRYSHTIDPATGKPVDHHLLSVSVIAPSAILADGFATAFMVMGTKKALEFLENHPELQAFFIESDNKGGYIESYSKSFKILIDSTTVVNK
jgi:thiamine biosynthesis lipoprotein